MINLPLMNDNITKDDIEVLIDFLKNNDIYTQNKNVREFERQWSQWLGVKHCVFVNSGSSANYITMAVIAELFGKGEVIVPTITWESDIASVFLAGHKPVLIDIDKKNLAMIETKILENINANTKAVFLTHVLGFNGLSENLINELEKRNILLIEDVCESHGALCGNRKCGSIGYASNFSFYYAHHLSTIEGGMICTNDDTFYEYARMFRSHGMLRETTSDEFKQKYYEKYPKLNPEFIFPVAGFNMRSTELNAVVGLNQLKRLDANNEKRRDNFNLFLDNLRGDKYYTDFDLEGSVNYAFVVLLKEADEEFFARVCEALRQEKVEFRRGTSGGGNQARQPYVMNRLPELDYHKFVNAEFVHQYGMYVGNYPSLEKERIQRLVQVLNNI